MAITNLTDLQIREDRLYSLFVNETIQKANIFNAISNGSIVLDFGSYSGFFAKTSQIEEPANIISRQDTTSNADRTGIKHTETNVSHVKLKRKLGPYEITDNSILEKDEVYSVGLVESLVSRFFSKALLLDQKDVALKLTQALIQKDAANKVHQTRTTFKPTDLIRGRKFYGVNSELWRSTVMHSDFVADGLEQMYNDKSGLSLLALDQGVLLGLRRPILEYEGTQLDVAVADSVEAGNQAGRNILFLPQNAIIVTQKNIPQIVVSRIVGKEQLGYRFEAEVTYTVSPKQHEWTKTFAAGDNNPTDTVLNTGANWTERAKSKVGSIGFAIQVENS